MLVRSLHQIPLKKYFAMGFSTTTGFMEWIPELDPTVIPALDFHSNEDVDVLKDALTKRCYFLGYNEQGIIDIICRRSNSQRIVIARAFSETFAQDLTGRFKRDFRGNFKRVMVALLIPLPDYYAQQLNKAMGGHMGFGADGSVLTEILCTLGNKAMKSVATSYEKRYGLTLEQALSNNTYGYFRRLCNSLVQANRDESCHVDEDLAKTDAKALHTAVVKRRGTGEIVFTPILASRSYPQLKRTFHEYRQIANHDIEFAIDSKFSGDIKRGLLAIVKFTGNHSIFLADLLHNAMKGLGTDNKTLTRIIVTRSELDLGSIKKAFVGKYNKSLKTCITRKTTGSFRKALLTLAGE